MISELIRLVNYIGQGLTKYLYVTPLVLYCIFYDVIYNIKGVLLSKINMNCKNENNYIVIDYTKLVINKSNEVYNILILDF